MNSQTMNQLDQLSVKQAFLKYLIPSLVGMLLMSVNFVADGIMVGNRLGPTALAGVGIAGPVYTIFVAMSLWIGIGAATQYSEAMGAKEPKRAQFIFTQALILIAIATLVIGLIAIAAREPLAYALGANAETYPYVIDYMTVMLLFGFIFTVENAFSIFVRNDGNPILSMAALITTAVSNIVLNFIFLYVLDFGVVGAATGTIIAAFLGMLVLSAHFFRRSSNLRLVKFRFDRALFFMSMKVGFPSFLAEMGISVFTVAHNVILEATAGTAGVAAFSVLNYTHGVMLMMFLGMGSAIQPLVSYYHGAKNEERKQGTIRIALRTAIVSGVAFFIVGQLVAEPMVSLFGDFPDDVTSLAVNGIRLFYIAYLFMGCNFVMMSYYQSVGNVRMATWITTAREFIFMIIMLIVLPPIMGVNGIWISVPVSELIVLGSIYWMHKRQSQQARLAAYDVSK